MAQLVFGTLEQIRFESERDFYFALGFLARNDGSSSLHWEHNERSGAWGSEGRIHCHQNPDDFPIAFQNAFTAGVGNISFRVNCNEYVACLINMHGFVLGGIQNQDIIRRTISEEYKIAFDEGLNP